MRNLINALLLAVPICLAANFFGLLASSPNGLETRCTPSLDARPDTAPPTEQVLPRVRKNQNERPARHRLRTT